MCLVRRVPRCFETCSGKFMLDVFVKLGFFFFFSFSFTLVFDEPASGPVAFCMQRCCVGLHPPGPNPEHCLHKVFWGGKMCKAGCCLRVVERCCSHFLLLKVSAANSRLHPDMGKLQEEEDCYQKFNWGQKKWNNLNVRQTTRLGLNRWQRFEFPQCFPLCNQVEWFLSGFCGRTEMLIDLDSILNHWWFLLVQCDLWALAQSNVHFPTYPPPPPPCFL